MLCQLFNRFEFEFPDFHLAPLFLRGQCASKKKIAHTRRSNVEFRLNGAKAILIGAGDRVRDNSGVSWNGPGGPLRKSPAT